ncbi:MAG: hypothetical protein ACKO9Q_21875, partial [Pirellula sp.]
MPLNFDNRFVRELPGETGSVGASRKVLGACYSPAMPVVPSDPKLLAYATEVAELIGVTES